MASDTATSMDEQSAQATIVPSPRPRFTPRHKRLVAALAAATVLIAAFFAFKNLFVAATVNGSPVSRLKVIEELERQGGQGVLDALITEKLILNEAEEQDIVVPGEELEAEMTKLKEGVVQSGTTFEAALAERGFTEESLRHSILVQLTLKRLLADILTVSEEDIDQYILENAIEVPEGDSTLLREGLRQQLQDEKFSQEAAGFIEKLKAEADIKYFTNY